MGRNGKAGAEDTRDFSDVWELALDGSGTGVWDRNTVTNEIRYSPTWFAILGYADAQPVSHIEESYRRLHPDDLPYVQAAIQAHFDLRTEFYEVEHRIRCRNGNYKWVLSRGKVTDRAEDGRALRMVGTTTDITATRALAEQLKIQNETLRENAARVAALSAQLAERTEELEVAQRLAKIGSWHWNLQNRSVHVSRECREIMGLPPCQTQLSYDQFRPLYHPDDYDRAMASYSKALRSKAPVTIEYRIIQPGGKVCNVLTHAEPVLQPEGRVSEIRGTSQDVTAYRQIETALRDSEDHYRHMVELHPQIPWTAGPDGGILEVGPKWFRLTGMTREETVPFGWINAVYSGDRARTLVLWQASLASGRPVDVEYRVVLPSGRTGWFRSRAAARVNHIGEIVRWYGTLEDVTDRHEAEAARHASEVLALRVLEATNDAVIVFGRTGRATYANSKAKDLIGRGSTLIDRTAPEIFKTSFPPLMNETIRRGTEFRENVGFTFFYADLNIWFELSLYSDTENVIMFLRDVSDKKRAEEQLHYAARHDFLTGSLNRGEFFARLNGVLAQLPPGKNVALFCLDIDNFKDINDVYGHPVGDKLLQMIVGRLNAMLHKNDLLARTGGDEFMLAQTGIATYTQAADLAERILLAVGSGFVINDIVIAASVSIGVSISTTDLSDIESIYKQADIALYEAKMHASGKYRFFHPDMQAQFDRAHKLRLDLKKAPARDELFLEFQPIIRISDSAIVGAEALLRWRHPSRGMIPPSEFIPIAEDSGLICDIGAWVLHEACSAAQKWPSDVSVSVNVSPRQFELSDICDVVSNALSVSGLTPARLKLEITESVFIDKHSSNFDILNKLRNLGVNLVLDDFGTGYSSLSYLDTFRFDVVKIDKFFIAKLKYSQQQPVLDAIIGMTSALGLPVTAEGVETKEQFDHVRRLGCQYAQGYLFGRPVAGSVLLKRLPERTGASTEPRRRRGLRRAIPEATAQKN